MIYDRIGIYLQIMKQKVLEVRFLRKIFNIYNQNSIKKANLFVMIDVKISYKLANYYFRKIKYAKNIKNIPYMIG